MESNKQESSNSLEINSIESKDSEAKKKKSNLEPIEQQNDGDKINIKKSQVSDNNNLKNEPKTSDENKTKLKKEIPIEKKPFVEFVNSHLIPNLIEEFNQRGVKIEKIYLENTFRPIAGDKCWIIFCEIKDTCNFWLSFEKEDISSPKSISLAKPNQNPSIIESFLIDEKRITLKLIISRILQRLNGQKLIGVN